jgi:hypothetical protein
MTLCSHADHIELADRIEGVRGVLRDRQLVGAPAVVPELRPDRLLRQLPQPARVAQRERIRARGRALGRARGRLDWCYVDEVAFVVEAR